MKIFVSSTDGGKTVAEIFKKYAWLKNKSYIETEKYFDESLAKTILRPYIEGDEKYIFEAIKDISKEIRLDEFVLKFNRNTFQCEEIELYDYWRE